ncbi:MAG TPA: hypothetical protein VOA19_15795, partial [Actinomycetes bacterium]|nr:hypothetical protein [Actinomycetes bacterium]
VADDPSLLEEAVAVLLAGQPAMAPIWHLAWAAHGPDPTAALTDLRRRLTTDADAAVTVATAWLHRHLATHPGAVATVSHSSLVDRVLAQIGPTGGDPVVGVAGADAIGPDGILNAVGTRALAEEVPTLVVATAVKLVPAEVFGRLGGPGFEVVPLETLAAMVVGAEVLSPAETGRRAEAVSRGRP